MADSGELPGGSSSLVIWGSTGRRLQFSKEDLRMPDRLRDVPNAAFYEKQWEAVSAFWTTRVLKEQALQGLQVADVVDLIEKDIAKRWQARRAGQALHKRVKRLLASDGGAVGAAAPAVLLTNICSLAEYEAGGTAESRRLLLAAVAARVEEVSKGSVRAVEALVDADAPQPEAPVPPAAKRQRTEGEGEGETAEPLFDDRVAVVCRLGSKEEAALAIAHLHGSRFDGRTVVCRFWGS